LSEDSDKVANINTMSQKLHFFCFCNNLVKCQTDFYKFRHSDT